MSKYDEYVSRKNRELDAQFIEFDTSDLYKQFIPYFSSGERIRVVTGDGEYVREGRVSVTTGWRPAFLLMHRASDRGSSDVLGSGDRVTHVQRGRQYVSVE